MYTFTIHFDDGSSIECKHIVSVTHKPGSPVTVSGDEIWETIFEPNKSLFLRSETESYSVNGAHISAIKVEKE